MDFNHENCRTEIMMQINKCMLCTQNYIIRQLGRKFQYFNKFDYWYIFHEIKKIFFHILYHIYTCIHKFIQQHCIHILFLTLWQTDHAFQTMCTFLLSEIKDLQEGKSVLYATYFLFNNENNINFVKCWISM